jgi:uncharacterized peroxidase-related enzyme
MSWVQQADLPELPAVFGALSLNSQALEVVEQLNEGLAFGSSTLTRVQEEAIATVVSVANRCRYGALTHSGFLRRYSGDSALASQMLVDHTKTNLSSKDRKMLDFAVRVTLEPGSLAENDLQGLQAVGFDDRDIVSVVMLTCLFNFMNRVASSLGVEVPSNFQRAVEDWLTGPATQEAWLLNLRGAATQTVPDQEECQGEVATLQNASPEPALSEAAPVASSQSVTTEPEKDQSPLSRFVEECCCRFDGASSTARDLYIAYLRWCDENRQSPLLQSNLGIGLGALGFRRRRRGHGRHWWLGIALKNNGSGD